MTPSLCVQDCWATIRQHESLDYDAEELLAHNQRQADLTDFTLSIQRTKREQARQAASAATAPSPMAAPAARPTKAAPSLARPPLFALRDVAFYASIAAVAFVAGRRSK